MTLPAAYLEQFSAPDGYLEFAATGPMSRRVRKAMDALAERLEAKGAADWDEVIEDYEDARAAMARLVETSSAWVTPVHTTSEAIFQVAFGLVGAGGNVVIPSNEFPANVYPWLRAAALGGPEVRLVDIPGDRLTPGAISAAVDSDTRAVSFSHVGYRTGFRADIDGIAEATGDALVVVDAIHALGAVRSQLGAADVLVAGAYKWLRAGWGGGVAAFSERTLDRLQPHAVGWYGVEDFLDFEQPPMHEPRPDAERFHEGSPPMFGAMQMRAAVEVIEIAGIDAIEAAIVQRASQMEEALRAVGAEVCAPWETESERAGIVCVRMPGESSTQTAERLIADGLQVSDRQGWVRISVHATTPAEIVERVVASVTS